MVGDVVDEEAAVGSSVVGLTQGLIALLTCGVPYLQGDHLAIHSYVLVGKIDSKSGFKGVGKFAVLKHLD